MRKIHIASLALAALTAAAASAGAQQDPRHPQQPQQQDPRHPQPPVPQAEQQRRIQEEQHRTNDYRQHVDAQVRATQQQAAALQAQQRMAQARAAQDYQARLAQQQARVRVERNYSADPYISTPHTFRYRIGTTYRETNQYGADVLRQAVNYGYQDGYRAGQADRTDHWRSDYANSPAYREATYGYSGQYVDQSDYSFYFRQGFQRGYQDGYSARLQYGNLQNGTASILAGVLTGILGLTTLR